MYWQPSILVRVFGSLDEQSPVTGSLEGETSSAPVKRGEYRESPCEADIVEKYPDKCQNVRGIEKYLDDFPILFHSVKKPTQASHVSNTSFRGVLALDRGQGASQVPEGGHFKFRSHFWINLGFESSQNMLERRRLTCCHRHNSRCLAKGELEREALGLFESRDDKIVGSYLEPLEDFLGANMRRSTSAP